MPALGLEVPDGNQLWLKAENFQRTWSFKLRGAYNAVASLRPDECSKGVITYSSGNHGQAVAWAARELGAPARVFMPQDSPMAKVDATRSYGAEVVLDGKALEESIAAAMAYVEETGGTFIHPFEDPEVIAGQGAEDLAIGRRMDPAAVHPDQGLVAGRPEAEEDRVDLVRQPRR